MSRLTRHLLVAVSQAIRHAAGRQQQVPAVRRAGRLFAVQRQRRLNARAAPQPPPPAAAAPRRRRLCRAAAGADHLGKAAAAGTRNPEQSVRAAHVGSGRPRPRALRLFMLPLSRRRAPHRAAPPAPKPLARKTPGRGDAPSFEDAQKPPHAPPPLTGAPAAGLPTRLAAAPLPRPAFEARRSPNMLLLLGCMHHGAAPAAPSLARARRRPSADTLAPRPPAARPPCCTTPAPARAGPSAVGPPTAPPGAPGPSAHARPDPHLNTGLFLPVHPPARPPACPPPPPVHLEARSARAARRGAARARAPIRAPAHVPAPAPASRGASGPATRRLLRRAARSKLADCSGRPCSAHELVAEFLGRSRGVNAPGARCAPIACKPIGALRVAQASGRRARRWGCRRRPGRRGLPRRARAPACGVTAVRPAPRVASRPHDRTEVL
jgi:hypothetical protein